MNSRLAAALLFMLYAVNSQWAFRCQRVVRGVLLVARDSAAAHRNLFASLVPTSYVASVWVGRLLWLAAAFFAWRGWDWWGVVALVVYGFTLGACVDMISPWPSYRKLLNLIKCRITTGAAGLEAITLLPTVHHIDQQLADGLHFERITVGVWLSRATPMATASPPATGSTPPAREQDALSRLADTSHRVLDTYIDIHDNILGVPWYRALRRVIPIPGIFDRIPYPEHRDALSALSVELRGVRNEAQALSVSTGVLSAAEARFCTSLQEYCNALLDSVTRLQQMCHSMAEKADGHHGPPWAEYRRTLSEYEDSCKRYMRVGERLNVDFRALRGEP